jgi:pimeloyl-ACP methyl ester carboxylesterase
VVSENSRSDSGGEHLYYEAREGTGPLLLMVHGMLSNRTQWLPNLAALSAVVRPVLVELWGHGRSPAPRADKPYTCAGYIAEFERIREELGAERMFICGQSFSAGLTLRYGLMHPDRVIGQIFTNSVSALAPSSRAGSAEDREAQARRIENEGHAAVEQIPYHPRYVRRLPEDVKTRLLEAAREVAPTGIAQAIRVTGPELSVLDVLDRIERPTLLVNGAQEKGFQAYREVAERGIPGCRIVDLPAGHAVNLEAPEQFDEAVVRFVQDCQAEGPHRA